MSLLCTVPTSRADELALAPDSAVKDIHKEAENGKAVIKTLLKDSTTAITLNSSPRNIENADGFSQNMDARKHSFLLRGYFRRLNR